MSNFVEKRVFLVGCPRSGTTLLQSLLVSHSAIHSFPETHYFRKGFKGIKGYIKRGYLLAEILRQWQKENLINEEFIPGVKVSWSRKKMVEQFVEILDTLTLQQNKTIWIEKTPGHVLYINRITSYINDAKFIHIIRDGRAVVASLYDVTHRYPEVWGGPRSIQQCIRQWNRCIRKSYSYVNNQNHIHVNYSSVTKRTEEVLQKLCEFLNVTYEENVLDGYMKSAKSVIAQGEEWKSGNLKELYDTGLNKFYDIFNKQQQKQIQKSLDFRSYDKINAVIENL